MFKFALLALALMTPASAYVIGIDVENVSITWGDSGGPMLVKAGEMTATTVGEVSGLSWLCSPMYNNGEVLTHIGQVQWESGHWVTKVYLGVDDAIAAGGSTCALKQSGNTLDTVSLAWTVE